MINIDCPSTVASWADRLFTMAQEGAKHGDCGRMCTSCAFRKGSPTQQESHNVDNALNCLAHYGNYGPRNDSGSAARFFYCAKTSRLDRNEGCEALADLPLLWSSGTQNPGSFQSEGTKKSSPNNHPTVKPVSLMRYLAKLFTPAAGHILDPFNGSGSTGKAAIYEHFDYTGIDMDAHNILISEARISYALRNRSNQLMLL